MSYLLTEIAMEMLGWQFYDTDGVPRPINLEGINLATTEGAQPLEQALNITFLDQKLSIKAEADSSSIENDKDTETQEKSQEDDTEMPYTSDAASQEICGESDNSESSEPFNENSNIKSPQNQDFIINNASTNTFSLKIQSVVGGIHIDNDEQFPDNEANFHTPLAKTPLSLSPTQELSGLTISKVPFSEPSPVQKQPVLKISKVASAGSEALFEAKATQNKTFTPNFNVISMTKMPLNQNSTQSSTSERKSNSDFSAAGSINLDLKQKLESEMFKTVLDLDREKSVFLKTLDNETKKNTQSFRKSLETYRSKEINSLQNELENMYELRQKAEQLAASKYPTTFPMYLKRSNTLSSTEFLESAEMTLPALCTTNSKKKSK